MFPSRADPLQPTLLLLGEPPDLELATACACELGRHRPWFPTGLPVPQALYVNRWGHFTDETTEAKTSHSCLCGHCRPPHAKGQAPEA